MRYHFTPIRILTNTNENKKIRSIDEDVEKLEHTCMVV